MANTIRFGGNKTENLSVDPELLKQDKENSKENPYSGALTPEQEEFEKEVEAFGQRYENNQTGNNFDIDVASTYFERKIQSGQSSTEDQNYLDMLNSMKQRREKGEKDQEKIKNKKEITEVKKKIETFYTPSDAADTPLTITPEMQANFQKVLENKTKGPRINREKLESEGNIINNRPSADQAQTIRKNETPTAIRDRVKAASKRKQIEQQAQTKQTTPPKNLSTWQKFKKFFS